MSSGQPDQVEPTCNGCGKSQKDLTNALKRCAKCKTQNYCSRECQKADWKHHKQACSKSASESAPDNSNNSTAGSASASAQTTGLCSIPKPFTALHAGTWLHNRPEQDVFKLLVDTYRMRVEDGYKLLGEVDEGSLYAGADHAEVVDHFRSFLANATRVDGKRDKRLLPDWWSAEKMAKCLDFAGTDSFSNIRYAVEKHDIQDHYRQPQMPMQLRMFGEKLDGTMPGGQSGEQMLQLQLRLEAGNIHATHISL